MMDWATDAPPHSIPNLPQDLSPVLLVGLVPDSASALPVCRMRARLPAVMLAQVARCRRAVDWILSPPSVHFYKLHHRLRKEARPTESNVRRFCPVCPVSERWQINPVDRKPVRSKYGGTVLRCLLLDATEHK
jgi:hypothetical protein